MNWISISGLFSIEYLVPILRILHAFLYCRFGFNLFRFIFKPLVNFANQRILVNRIVSGFPF